MKALDILCIGLLAAAPISSASPTSKPQQLSSPEQTPEGLSKSDWSRAEGQVSASGGAASIPFNQLGAEAQKQYKGDGIGISVTANGACLRAEMQDLEGEATAEGLWLRSTTEEDAGKPTLFRVRAEAFGRVDGGLAALAERGVVRVEHDRVAWLRAGGVAEEYRVGTDGVRQDFVVLAPPTGAGELRVEMGPTPFSPPPVRPTAHSTAFTPKANS